MLPQKNLTVLLIDDEVDILELLDEEFRYSGYETFTANCGNDAIKILENKKINIIVSDYKMPNGNGLSVLSFVNQMKEPPAFFFVSGQADMSIDDVISAGARKFFHKPFDLDVLIREIETEMNN